MSDPPFSPPTLPLPGAEPSRRRTVLIWVVGVLGVLVLLQLLALGLFFAVPGLRNQIRPFWIMPALPPPPEAPHAADLPPLSHPLKFSEQWDQPTQRWEQSLARVTGGAYEMRVDVANYDSYGLLASDKAIRDFDLAVDVQQVGGDPTAEYGIRFRQTGPSDYLMFSISGSGYYRLVQVKSGAYHSLVPWTFDGRVKTGPNAINRLRVVAQSAAISGYVNDAKLASADDPIDTGGQLTLGVTTFGKGGVVVHFDNVAGEAEGKELHEDFSNAENTSWSIGGATIVNGSYELEAGPGIQSWQEPLPTGADSVGDFRLDLDATLVFTDSDSSAYGVIFGDGGSFDFYSLYLFPQGAIGLFRSDRNGQSALVEPVALPQVKTGKNATNHLSLELRGQVLSITLNGTKLPDLQLDQPIKGMVGMIVSNATRARFDNFQLQELTSGASGTS